MSPVLSELSPLNHATSTVYLIQKRQISFETYEKYFSPDSPPIAMLMYYLNSVHDMTGLPWYISLGICTIFLRLVIALPLRIISKRNVGKNKVQRGYTRAVTESMTYQVQLEAAKQKWSDKEAKGILMERLAKNTRELRQKTGAHPLKTAIYPMLQIPVWICMSFALRNMAGYRVLGVEAVLSNPEMVREGALWFSNLLVPDPLFIIPIVSGCMHLINNEVNTYNLPKGIGTSVIKWLGRGLSFVFIPFACIVPSVLSLYWTYSAFTAVIVSLILNLERSKKYLDLEPPGGPEHYYRYYKAMLEKETGVIVPPQKEEEKSTDSDGDISEIDKTKLREEAKPSEHVQPSELSRPAEHNKLSESKQLGNKSTTNR